MFQTSEQGTLIITARAYRLMVPQERPLALLTDANGCLLADLFYLSSVHTLQGMDDTTWTKDWVVEQANDKEVTLALVCGSSIWDQKTYRFHCLEDELSYEIEVHGKQQVTQIDYLGGYYSGDLRWGSGFFCSGQQFKRGFNPEPNSDEQIYFPASGGAAIDLMGVPLPGRADWFFTPPPFCLAFETSSGWLGMGIEARPSQHLFTELEYHGRNNAFYLSLACDGRLSVDGQSVLPVVGFVFSRDEYEALGRHVSRVYRLVGPETGLGRQKLPFQPAWWSGPIFCGWGAQCFMAAQAKGRASDYARQEHYQAFIRTLEKNNLNPGVVVIDDKWQAEYGTNQVDISKWPDLAGFIRQRHTAGQKVLLWLKAWDPEGVPPEECIRNASGLPLSIDPTHPGCVDKLRRAVRLMLDPGGYGADGFKIDFTARIPSGPGLRTFGNSPWGLELMKLYLGIIYDEAKRVKPEALVVTHAPHPYLAEVVDMIRLNDINIGLNARSNILTAMRHRARVARIACPQALIDTDNWPMPDKATWREYVKIQPELGIPALYFDRGIDATGELFDEDDYNLIRQVWSQRQ